MRVGILTSGGDCAGLNAVIRAVVLRAVRGYGFEVVGIHEATHGLLQRPVAAAPLTPDSVRGILHQGGTILRTTNRGNPFAYPTPDGRRVDRSAEIIEGYRLLGLDALIGVGGDGSLAILRRLAAGGRLEPRRHPQDHRQRSRPHRAVGGLQHRRRGGDRGRGPPPRHGSEPQPGDGDRGDGRDAGHIALTAGIAGGADVILIPEITYEMAKVCAKIEERRTSGRNFSLVVVAESVPSSEGDIKTYTDAHGQSRYGGIGRVVAETIAARTGAETRVTVLGHVQRGGSPVPLDRLLGSAFGVAAVDLVAAGRFDRVVGWRERRVIDEPIGDACAHFQAVDPDDALVRTARGLGIAFGD